MQPEIRGSTKRLLGGDTDDSFRKRPVATNVVAWTGGCKKAWPAVNVELQAKDEQKRLLFHPCISPQGESVQKF